MSYMHIDNLYKSQTLLMFRECYALEKIHGTSAHVMWKDGHRLGPVVSKSQAKVLGGKQGCPLSSLSVEELILIGKKPLTENP